MRRLCAFLIAGALVAAAAQGAEAQMRIGAKGGLTFSTVSFDPEDEDTQTLLGFAGGGEVQIPLGASGVSLQPELLYVRKGVEFDEGGGATSKFKLDYIEIPVLLRYDIPAAAVTPFLYAGGSVGFEASCKAEGEDGSISIDVDCEDVDVDTESTDFGVLFGGGIGFAAGPGRLFVEGRYNIGLVDVDASEGLEAKNRSGAVMLGYSVSLNPRMP